LILLGRACEPRHVQDAPAFAEGANQFKVNFTELRELFRREVWLRENCLVAVAAGQDGMAGLAGDAFTATREEIQRVGHIIFSGQPSHRTFWLGESDKMSRDSSKPCIEV
jgi:hypothetical protein